MVTKEVRVGPPATVRWPPLTPDVASVGELSEPPLNLMAVANIEEAGELRDLRVAPTAAIGEEGERSVGPDGAVRELPVEDNFSRDHAPRPGIRRVMSDPPAILRAHAGHLRVGPASRARRRSSPSCSSSQPHGPGLRLTLRVGLGSLGVDERLEVTLADTNVPAH